MGDVKWIHIATGIFDDEKIKLIEDMPDADAIIVIWFKLLCLAGTENKNGMITFSDRIHYTDKMLATVFRRKESTVSLALRTFEEFGMIEILDGIITIPNWDKHQNIKGLERIRESGRKRVQAYREREKLKISECNVTETKCNGIEKNREEENRKEKNREEENKEDDRLTVYEVMILFNSICASYPQVKSFSEARKKAVKARQKQYSDDQIQTVFEKAEASHFLKGGNGRDWSADFDWLMKDANFAKVLDGNYDDKRPADQAPQKTKAAAELDAAYDMMNKWAQEG